jgi:hypothetical protein
VILPEQVASDRTPSGSDGPSRRPYVLAGQEISRVGLQGAYGPVRPHWAAPGETDIHLDFHTPPFQREIGAAFSPERFACRLDEANVNSIALFAKGCHGMSYYDTAVSMRHPNLEFDLLAAQIEVCHDRDIAA